MIIFLLILQIIAVNIYSDAVCTWPDDFADSTWMDSLKGDMVFSSTTMSGWAFDVKVQSTATVQTLNSWECVIYDESGPYLIMKTTETFIQFITEHYTGYRCIIPEKITDYSYRYYQAEPIQAQLGNESVFISTSETLTDPSILCQAPSTGAEFQVMIKKGNETSAKIACPYNLLADYTFTYSSSDGTVACDAVSDVGTVNMCTNITEISVQAPACSPYPLYSNGNSSWCVDVVTVGSDTFVSLYNGQQDSANPDTYQFVCVGINSKGTSLSVTSQHCKADQSPTELPVNNSGSNVGAVWSLSISAGIIKYL
ncbi:uncharacterized protein LOC123558443 [Mercenaria mercenaria]|uniref:uncharacterized protein LOC123558443 n=1 Tax=Mercenaria mercenaria TaxID=6596 RepID=UPI00234F95EE|nr:uncharacterized protein LOC123558443 [Mercenaria mercenaria]